MNSYIAPAALPYTHAHLLDETGGSGGVIGKTMCGLSLKQEELWVPVPEGSVDRVCPDCRNPGVRQQLPLWDVGANVT
jgi:hypothetical protein